MRFRGSSTVEDYLFPGHPIAAPVGRVVLSSIGLVSDAVVVGKGTGWERLADDLPEDTGAQLYVVDQGADFVGRVIGLATTGLRVTAFSTPSDAEDFLRLVSRQPFPLAAVVHAFGQIESSEGAYGFQFSAATPQESVDFALLAQRVTEESLVPGACSHRGLKDLQDVATLLQPESDLLPVWLPRPDEQRVTPSPSQEMLFGKERSRIPSTINLDRPVGVGPELQGATRMVSQAGIGPFAMDEVSGQIDKAFDEFGALTGRIYSSVSSDGQADADYTILTDGPGEILEVYGKQAASRGRHRFGVVRIAVTSPFPSHEVVRQLRGSKSVTVLDTGSRSHGQLATAVRSVLHKAGERGAGSDFPLVLEARSGRSLSPTPADAVALVENMLPGGKGSTEFELGVSFAPEHIRVPSLEAMYQTIRRAYPAIEGRGLVGDAVDVQSSRKGRTIVVAGTDIASLSAVSEAFATSGFEVFNLPSASSSDHNASTAGQTAHALVSIGSISPVVAESGPIDAIVSTRSDELAQWLSDPRLSDDAALFLPAGVLSEIDRAPVTGSGRPLHVYSVGIGPNAPESHTLAALVAAWVKTDSTFASDQDAFFTAFLTRLAELMSWNRKEHTRVANLVVKTEATARSQPEEGEETAQSRSEPMAPQAVRKALERADDFGDISRFWRTIGYSFSNGQQEALSPDPYISSNLIPARTGSFRSGSPRNGRLPELYPENCSGCNSCTAFCPEGAIRTTALSLEKLVEHGIEQVARSDRPTTQLDRIGGPLAKQAHRLAARDELRQYQTVRDLLEGALEPVLTAMKPAEDTKRDLLSEFDTLLGIVGKLPVVRTEAFFDRAEAGQKGTGELFLLGIDPGVCTSCGLCTAVCADDAMGMRDPGKGYAMQARLLANSIADVQPDAVAGRSNPMDVLMGRKASDSVLGSDNAIAGSGAKMTLRLVCSLIEAEQVPRYAALVDEAGELIESIRNEINDVLHSAVDVNDFEAFGNRLDALKQEQVTARDLADLVSGVSDNTVDSARLSLLTGTLSDLESVRRELESGQSGDGKARLAAVFGSGPLLAAHRPFPFNPYPFPWIHIENGSPIPAAEGLFEGVMSHMCSMFSLFRRARNLAKGLDAGDTGTHIHWSELTPEEWTACPPVCVFTEDEADIPRSWLRGRTPINVFILDGNGTLLGEGWGSRLWPLARPDWFVLHSTAASFEHFADGVRAGVGHRGSSVFRLYAPEPREHGFESDETVARMLAAVQSRAFPLIRYEPDSDLEWTERWSLLGNEKIEDDWVSPSDTPAHWMAAEGRFRKYFATELAEESIDQVEIQEQITSERKPDEKAQTVLRLEIDGRDVVLGVKPEVVEASRDARSFWRLLQELSGIRSSALAKARSEVSAEIEKQVAAARKLVESEAQAEVDRVTSEHTAIYHDKLKQKLLALSGFGPGTDAHEQKLTEYTESE